MPRRVGVRQRVVQRVGRAGQVLWGGRAAAGAAPHPLRGRVARPDSERRAARNDGVGGEKPLDVGIVVSCMILPQSTGVQALSGVGERGLTDALAAHRVSGGWS
ncbi:hypothetical protein, partial [Chloroflexus sp.]|uniref:hypothetical protein n=1 Tax=Chloroflexus sp. TaxID=1904827 RepID=UPI00257D82B4